MKSFEVICLEGRDPDYIMIQEQSISFFSDDENQPEHCEVTFRRNIHNCDGYGQWEVTIHTENHELSTVIKTKVETFDKTYGYSLLPVLELQLTLDKVL